MTGTTRGKLSQDIIGKVYLKCNGKCQACGKEEELDIHHIDLNRINNDISNLTLLCKFCHKLTHLKEGKKYYDEEELKDYLEKEEIIFRHEIGWKLSVDYTDHFSFRCPECDKDATVYKILLWGDGKNGHGYVINPCFYFYLKCSRCRISGQRKSYLNPKILEFHNKKARERGNV